MWGAFHAPMVTVHGMHPTILLKKELLAQLARNLKLGSRPILGRAAAKPVTLRNKVSGGLHHAITLFGSGPRHSFLCGRFGFGRYGFLRRRFLYGCRRPF